MNKLPRFLPRAWRRAGLLAPFLLTLTLHAITPATTGVPPSASGESDARNDSPAKTHRLFMGMDLSVVSKDSEFPVKGVQNNSFIVDGPKGRFLVPIQDPKYQFKAADALKVTNSIATMDKLTFERSYTLATSPLIRLRNANRLAAYMSGGGDAADAALRRAEGQLHANNAPLVNMFDPTKSSSAGPAAAVNYEGAAQNAMRNMDTLSMVGRSSSLTGEMLAEPYDAVTVTFDLSSERPIENPYIVIIMRFLEDKDRKDSAKTWIYGERLSGIDQHPRPYRIVRAGFPEGYQIDNYHVHLYENGKEIATNISRKEVALTADEAFQYAVVQHITANRNQTREPAKARAYWPADLFRRFTPNQLNQIVYVKVAKDGRALGIYQDEKCTRPSDDPEIAALAPELRFLPALEKGKPVEGIATGKLALGN